MERYFIVATDAGMLSRQRKKLGLTQEEVAAKAGIKLSQYQRYESHENVFSNSSLRIVNAVMSALELDPTAYANGDYSFVLVDESDPKHMSLSPLEIKA